MPSKIEKESHLVDTTLFDEFNSIKQSVASVLGP